MVLRLSSSTKFKFLIFKKKVYLYQLCRKFFSTPARNLRLNLAPEVTGIGSYFFGQSVLVCLIHSILQGIIPSYVFSDFADYNAPKQSYGSFL